MKRNHEKEFILISNRFGGLVFRTILNLLLLGGGVLIAQHGKVFFGGVICGVMFLFMVTDIGEYLFNEWEEK